MSINLELIHRAVLEKLWFEKTVKKIWNPNISEIYRPIILLKKLDRELSKIYLYKKFWSDSVNFTPVIVRHTKLIFINFSIFTFL